MNTDVLPSKFDTRNPYAWIIVALVLLVIYLIYLIQDNPTVPVPENTTINVSRLKNGEFVFANGRGEIIEPDLFPIEFPKNEKIGIFEAIKHFSVIRHQSTCTDKWCTDEGCFSETFEC